MIPRGRLFWKYVLVFVALVSVALLVSGAVEIYFSYYENEAALIAIQKEKALGAASRIEVFVKEIERQMGWTTQPQLVAGAAAVEQRKVDFIRLQRQVAAITELSHIDAGGREQLRVSRLAMDVIGSQADLSTDPKFVEPRKGRTWFGPVYFRKESEPYMTIAMPQSGGGVTVAEVNLKFIWDVISQIKIGKAGRAYVVDGEGNLIAHPDISLVLQKTSLASLPQVKAALAAPGAGTHDVTIAHDSQQRQVLTAFSTIPTLRWTVFAEQPLGEAFEPLYDSLKRTVGLLGFGIVLSVVIGLVLARRMVHPIRVLQEGAARIGTGELGHRIQVKTGDELEALAAQFNQMTGQLQESYATLEHRVVERTRELTETLEQQTATSEVLAVISESPTDVEPVFAAILRNGLRLSGADYGGVFRFEDGVFRPVLTTEVAPEMDEYLHTVGIPAGPHTPLARVALDLAPVMTADLLNDPRFSPPAVHRREGMRSVLSVPMLREGRLVGALTFHTREVRPFTDKQVDVVKTFADQAVIAIENVRLFTELQEKNRAITEALEQQTATAEILRVISRSQTELDPVFQTIAASSVRLCGGTFGAVFRFDESLLHLVAHHNFTPAAVDAFQRTYPLPLSRDNPLGRSIADRQVVQIADLEEDAEYSDAARARGRMIGYRALVGVPMVQDTRAIGAIAVGRQAPGPFTEKQIEVLQTFADQAVIAIENVRLFTELQDRNRQVTEALEQQTATAEILRVISSSPTDVQPVLDAVAEKSTRLCGANDAIIMLVDGASMRPVAHVGALPTLTSWSEGRPITGGTIAGRAIIERRTIHVPDVADADMRRQYPETDAIRDRIALRTVLATPLMREGSGAVVGVIVIRRVEMRPFGSKQIELLKTFADQAVIAIENVRLFTELQDRTRELARSVAQLQALSEVGQAVSSTLDLDTVLNTIVSRASQLAGADGCSIYEYDEATQSFRVRATQQSEDDLLEQQRVVTIHAGEGAVGRLAETLQPVQIPDILAAGAYRGPLKDALTRRGYRAVLAVPLLQEDRLIGGLVLTRKAPGEFPAETVALMKTFATQSALATQNARLFRALEEKSRELEIANRHKSEFLANMSHELRTPLNAIIGFSEVLVERMFGELNDKQDEYLRDIYSSGRHLLSLINDILDLSKVEAGRMELDLTTFDLPQAVANALTLVRSRAEAHAIRLAATVDERLGDFVADERKVKQILLNLLSNAVKFTPDGGHVTVTATLADGAAEIAVADTGIGIAPEDQAAVFEEFRQVGTDYARKREGTGLGLALTRKFVELHGGTIWLKSAPGEGSIFTFTLPVRPWPTS